MASHSPAFVALRDALLRLGDDERRCVADLIGAMHDSKPPISGELACILGMIAVLDPTDRRRFAKWCARYLSRWGQVPVAASRLLATPEGGQRRTGREGPALAPEGLDEQRHADRAENDARCDARAARRAPAEGFADASPERDAAEGN